MTVPIGAALKEARGIVGVIRQERDPVAVGSILVSGMLSEQLARELAAGAPPGGVIFGDASRLGGAAVVVRVIAGEPSSADDELVSQADAHGIPVVLVQLWPQAQWIRPYVLSPFVVECRAGEGFPLPEISRRIVEAVEYPVALARRAPVLQDAVAQAVVGTTAIRAAILGVLGARSRASRPLIALEQVRMLTELLTLKGARGDALPALAGGAGAAVGAGFVFREAARRARQLPLPAPVVNAAFAAAGTWALGEALRRLEARLP